MKNLLDNLNVPWTEIPWSPKAGNTVSYQLQLDDQSDFSSPLVDVITSESEYQVPADQPLQTGQFFIRGRTFDDDLASEWSITHVRIVIDPDHQYVYFAEENSDGSSGVISRYDRITRSIETIVTGAIDPRDVAVSHSLGKVYWSDLGDWSIKRANLDGSDIEIVVSGNFVEYFEIDDTAGFMFWHTGGDLAKSDLNGEISSVIIEAVGPIDGMATDPDSQHVYISISGLGVMRSAYDGSGFTLTLASSHWPQSEIYYDSTIEMIYFYRPDSSVRAMLRINPDGSQQELLSDQGPTTPLTYGLTIDESSGHIFFSNHDGMGTLHGDGINMGVSGNVVDHRGTVLYGMALGRQS